VLPVYKAMGSPLDPTPAQVEQMNKATVLPAPEATHLKDGVLHLELTPNAMVLVKVSVR